MLDMFSVAVGGVYTLIVAFLGWAIGYSTAKESGKLEAYEEQFGETGDE